MFKVDKYYLHKNGRDAVIRIHEVRDMGPGFELTVTWHCLSYKGFIDLGTDEIQFLFITKEDSRNWEVYNHGDRSYA